MAACGSDAPATTQVVANAAVLAGVSADQATVASYVGAARQPDGAYVGTLQVSAMAGGAARTVEARATGATWARGSTLYYLADPQTVEEGTPARARRYGALKAWLPAQGIAVALGGLVGAFTVSQDGSAVAFIDRTAASSSAPGTVKVWSTAMCTPDCAAPIAIADGATSAALLVANDGKNLVVYVPKIGASPPQLALVAFPDGTVTSLPAAAAVHAPMLSPDGATVAWVESGNQIASAATASPSDVTRIAVTAGAVVSSAIMAGPSQFVAGVKATSADAASLYLVTPSAQTPLGITAPARAAVVEQTPSDGTGSQRYLFFATAIDDTSGTEDLWVTDLTNPTAPPVQLAAATTGNPVFSDDATAIRFFEDVDPSTGIGDVYLAALPAAAPVKVAARARQAAFEPGTTTLVYLKDVDASTGVGSLGRWDLGAGAPSGRSISGVLNFQLPRTAEVLYYTQGLGTGSDGVYQTDPL